MIEEMKLRNFSPATQESSGVFLLLTEETLWKAVFKTL